MITDRRHFARKKRGGRKAGSRMDCTAAERRISSFLSGDLDERDTEEFVGHIEQCEACMEELAIQYLISEGMHRLEDGGAFDLNKELNDMLVWTKRRVHHKKIFDRVMFCAEIAAVAGSFLLSFFVLY